MCILSFAFIFYHLGKNLDVAESIAKMNPAAAGREIEKIAANLSAPKAKSITKAEQIYIFLVAA